MSIFRRKKSVNITDSDPVYKVAYLGNVLTLVAKGEECSEKPLQTLWKNYTATARKDIKMRITICSSGLKAETAEHGLTEYWAHRITWVGTHPAYPKLFAWIYRHEGKKMKPELRFHTVLCPKADKAEQMATLLQQKVLWALNEFKRDKISKQNSRKLHEILTEIAPTVCKRRQILSTGQNFRPPMERSKSAPRLLTVEEEEEEAYEDEEDIEDENASAGGMVSTLKRHSSNGSSSHQSTGFGSSSRASDPGHDDEEEDILLEDDTFSSQSWSTSSNNSSPAGSWNVKRKASGRVVGVKSSSASSGLLNGVYSDAFAVHDLRRAIEETSSVESGFEESRTPT
ncbi:putative Protein FAM43A [Hypsibius exemplaris]|uniref:PID domain-containing protein n=1 Tax=Hypsibius exemplaris TaxID=2072580 RepID=A0A1W0X1G0_HYPEX|nr:putative Protein FAM43A [Hypsibius exemplaris]